MVRPIFLLLLVVVALAFIGMFFVSERSKHVQIGYELSKLRRERDELRETARRLDFEILQASAHDLLAQTAKSMGLKIQPPDIREPRR